VLLALSLFSIGALSHAAAGPAGQDSDDGHAQSKHKLKDTIFASSGGASASCGSAGCFAATAIYSQKIVCPVTNGESCTFEVDVSSFAFIDGGNPLPGDLYYYQFLVDGAAPTGGGTDNNGLVALIGPNIIAAYSVSSGVINTSKNQNHQIVVNIACLAGSNSSNGCSAGEGPGTSTIRVFTP